MSQPQPQPLMLLAAQFRGWAISYGEMGAVQAYWESEDGRRRWLHVERTPEELVSWLRATGAPP